MAHFNLDVTTALGLGQDSASLTVVQISLRGLIVFAATLAIIRCGDRRFLSQKTAFDAVLGFILASMLARAVNGTSAFFPTLGGGFVLVMLHRLLAYWSRRSHRFGLLIKGASDVIIREGQVNRAAASQPSQRARPARRSQAERECRPHRRRRARRLRAERTCQRRTSTLSGDCRE